MNVDRPGVPIRFQSGPRQPVLSVPTGTFPQVRRWGGWGSNQRPEDYEKYGFVHHAR
jgi:hypothetical protein